MVLILHIVQLCFIFVPSFVKIPQRDSDLLSGHDFPTKSFKGHNSVQNIGGITKLVLSTPTDCVLHL